MQGPAKPSFFHGGAKTIATVASTGAAMVSIITFLHAWGIVGDSEGRVSVGNLGARWIGIRPALDTLHTVGDTLHLAATITDKSGSVLFGAHPTWTTENPAVATVEQDGSVVARGPGITTVIAVAGEVTARAHVVVNQTVAAVRIAGDSAIAMQEGDTRPLEARAFDARGYVIPNRTARWKIEDGGAIALDSNGAALANDAGRAVVGVTIDGVGAQALVTVAPSPAAIAIVKGDAQRARAGATLPDRVVVRVVNRRGRPVEGTLVRFRPDANGGVVDPAAVVTDADGRARTSWSLGELPGRQRLFASVERVDSAIVLVAEAQPVAANTRVQALRDSLRGVVGAVDTVGVRITDSTGRALADVPVSWTTEDGSVKAVAARTDSLGCARAEWTLGQKARMQRVRARVGGDVAPLAITALVAAGTPASVALTRVRGGAEDASSVRVSVVVRDSFGNVVPRAAARLHARAGTVTPAVLTTDSLGQATAAWTIPKSGERMLIASVKGSAAGDTLVIRAVNRARTQSASSRRPR